MLNNIIQLTCWVDTQKQAHNCTYIIEYLLTSNWWCGHLYFKTYRTIVQNYFPNYFQFQSRINEISIIIAWCWCRISISLKYNYRFSENIRKHAWEHSVEALKRKWGQSNNRCTKTLPINMASDLFNHQTIFKLHFLIRFPADW